MKRIEGTYEGTMKYKRYNGMNYLQFYRANKEAIEKHLEKYKDDKDRHRMFRIMYTDIIEGD